MNRLLPFAVLASALAAFAATAVEPPNAGRGAGTVALWNPHSSAPGNRPLTIRVLVLNYDPVVPAEGHRRLSQVFRWNDPIRLASECKEAMEYASGGWLRFEIVEWRNLNEIYARADGGRPTVEEYVRNRKGNSGWPKNLTGDYPRLLREQNVEPLVDAGIVDEVWVFSDHFFGLWEASMAGPGSFFINGGVYPKVPTRRPFAFYGFNYERGVAEMMHNASHRTEATMNRAYGPWNLKSPRNNWEKFSANDKESGGVAGVGTCHWPANAESGYDYGNRREVGSWADAFLTYPKLDLVRKPVSREAWSRGPDYHLDYMKWYFGHIPRAAGVDTDGHRNNWFEYIFDFQNYDAKGRPLPATADLIARDIADPRTAAHVISVAYRSPDRIDAASLGSDDIAVADSAGQPLAVEFVGGNEPGDFSYRVGRYRVAAPGGSWEKAPRGEFVVSLRPNSVRTGTGTALPATRLGGFRTFRADAEPQALAADADTTLLLAFEGNAAADDKKPTAETGVAYEPGVVGKGVRLAAGCDLRYESAGIVDPKAGSIEFWLKPDWNGDEKKGRVFFQAGAAFDNGLTIQIDGANNLRLIVWGDNPATAAVETNFERGVGVSGADWKRGEWHHVAATWADSGQTLALYIDGIPTTTAEGVKWLGLGRDFRIGASADATFDELRISTRARTAAEVLAVASVRGGIRTLTAEGPTAPLLPGGRAVVRASGRNSSGRVSEATRDVAWSSGDPKVVSVDDFGTIRAIRVGQTTIAARLGSLTATVAVRVTDPGLPTAKLVRADNVTRPGIDPVTIAIAYEDPDGIRRDSLAQSNIRVSGPNGFHQFAELVSVEKTATGTNATYRTTPPTGKWREADRGVYRIELMAFQVADSKGNWAAESVVGRFEILVPPAPR